MDEGKDTGEALRASEERFRLAALAGRMFAYEWNIATDVVVRSAEFSEVLGDEPLRTTGQQIMARIHPEDRERVKAALAALTPENPPLRITYRMARLDGTFVWVERTSRAYFDGQGRMLRLVGMLADVTERELARQALSDMTRRFFEAQEQERARIGRELHDDINQRLAMINVELEQLQANPSETGNRVPELRRQVTEISNDLQAMSHDLHSSKLDYLGVLAGIRSWCQEFAERQNMEIDFRSDVSGVLPLTVGLSLFRLLQEALNNVVKHSGVKRVEVELREEPGEIHLHVRDLGRGFDVESALQGKGLGLTSMRERVRLVNGTIEIKSKPMGGTAIHVQVPIETRNGSQRVAG